MKKQELLKLFALPNAFEEFQPIPNTQLTGWNGDRPILQYLIRDLRPSLILEVGSWMGQSAIHMGKACEALELNDTSIICIDTWLGSEEHWKDPELLKQMELRNGYPTFYSRFLTNVVNYKLQDRILPLPLPSQIAASYLKSFGIQADMLYLDGSHQEQDVYADLMSYWDLLKPGGCILGDDWSWSDSIPNAVKAFCSEKGIIYKQLDDINWLIHK